MKFRDKDGNVYDGVVAFRGSFCGYYGTDDKGNCVGCPVGYKANNKLCEKWIAGNPVEAARLMGYEVIEDGKDINTPTTRADILDAARNLVCGDRQRDYGDPAQSFQTIANLWIDYLQGKGYAVDISSQDAAIMLALLKVSRMATGKNKADSYVDACGYMSLAGELARLQIKI